MMELNDLWWLGVISYVFINSCALPQIHRLYTRKSAEDVSFWRDAILTTGVAGIAFYSYFGVGDIIYLIGNIVALSLSSTIWMQILWYRRKRRREGPSD